ncbi:hypothetical protein DBR47_00745 [Paucibacter sp. KBW04]|uniref:hypothetical protein n=1 Tax=Paucibacter sp. KBW04 TaxID=2153361 RepID=UPI000F568087|nr:hypothetical protein [Paucibacter sp. KBW04]RQO63133.1 hypothetical protein DBR47_00745 [Paucibacter sp. KBW04]
MTRKTGAYNKSSVAPGLQRAWQSLRILRTCTRGDISATAELADATVRAYVSALIKAGFIKVTRPRTRRYAGVQEVITLVRNTGPIAPIARADGNGVYDRNTDTTWNNKGEVQK